MKKIVIVLLILFNCIAVLVVSNYLFLNENMGFYESYSYPTSFYHHESGVRISPFFLFMTSLLLIIPLILFLLVRKRAWLVQFLFVGVCWLFWKTDFMQQTMFYYSPTSAYKQIKERIPFIEKYNKDASSIINYIEKNVGADSLKIEYQGELIIDSSGITKLKYIQFGEESTLFKIWKFNFPDSICNKMKNIQIIRPEIVKNKIVSFTLILEEKYEFVFYPSGEGSKEKKSYKQGYYLESYYYDRDYYYNDFWVINIQRSNG